jgi:phage terminase small subunit
MEKPVPRENLVGQWFTSHYGETSMEDPKKTARPKKVSDVPKIRNPKALARIVTFGAPLTGKRKPLKPREAKFVEIYAGANGTITLTEAAREAGYPESTCRRVGSELTNPEKNPHVVQAIQKRQVELNAKYNTTFERHMKDLQYIRDKAIEAGAWAAAVQAEYRRGQALGTIYIDRKEIRHGTIDSMSKEEVQKKLEALRKLYQGSPDVVDAQITESIEMEKEADHTEEFLDDEEAGSELLSEDEEGDDRGKDNSR